MKRFLIFWSPLLLMPFIVYVIASIVVFVNFQKDCTASKGIVIVAPIGRYYCVDNKIEIAEHRLFL